MKGSSLWMALWLVGVLFMSFNCLTSGVNRSKLVFGIIIVDGNMMTTSSRSLKEDRHDSDFGQGSFNGDVSLEDYRSIKPPSSSKASIKHGPIEHGVPSMPHIPKVTPSPPSPSSPSG